MKPKSPSLFRLRLRRFRRLKRGYYSFLLLVGCYLGSFLLPYVMSSDALVVKYQGDYYFPSFRSYLHETFGYWPSLGFFQNQVYSPATFGIDSVFTRTDYRELQQYFEQQDAGDWVLMPIVPYSTDDQLLEGNPPHAPSWEHPLGTDDSGRDVMVRLAYGFRISISFALAVTVLAYAMGIVVGAVLGYFGGYVDIIGQRFVEIWGAIPFLYTVMILSVMLEATFLLLVGILTAFGWLGISYYIRGEFYREKTKDYVAAARAVGEGNFAIMFRHILPNALTPVIAFAPFAIVVMINSLVALDFLGFGLPPPTPSWGEMLREGRENISSDWHLVVFPLLAIFFTLQLIVFIGEAVREAFDPKVFSRLR